MLAPPLLDPSFALRHQALHHLGVLARVRGHDLHRLGAADLPGTGPASRLQQLCSESGFQKIASSLLAGIPLNPRWQHDVRESWRHRQWQHLSQSRPQHFAGIEVGVDRTRSLIAVTHLKSQIDDKIWRRDSGAPGCELAYDPVPLMKIMLLMLSGGIMTAETCVCGSDQEASLIHIAWHCPIYADARATVMHWLPCSLNLLPTCFLCTGLVPVSLTIDIKAVLHLHLGLARLWQQHIEDWTNGRWRAPSEHSRDADPVGSAQPSDPIAPRPSTVATANGHELLYRADCVFCVKCGRQTKYHKHVHLKITSKQCTDRWLSEPGLHRATSRLADELAKLRDVYNKGLHTLHWNRQIGKDPAKVEQYGMLWCSVCGASWAWRYKANNLPRSVCRIPKNRPVPPAWWHSLPISEQVAVASPESETIEPVVILPEQPPLQHPSSIGAVHRDVPPRRRVRCKMPIRETTPQQRQSHTENPCELELRALAHRQAHTTSGTLLPSG